MKLYATILAGGSGTRFWPRSRAKSPKQFLVLQGTRSLLQATVDRLLPLVPPERIQVVTAVQLRAETIAQLPEVPADNILGEPQGRNTAAAVGLATILLMRSEPEAVMVVLPADHTIADETAFRTSLRQAALIAQQHRVLMTLGLHPTYPATGYGYIKCGEPLSTPGVPEAYRVARFVEKPRAAVAAEFVASGQYLWNSGMFVWSVATLAEELHHYLPQLWRGLHAYIEAWRAGAATEELASLYAQLPSISIDHGVLERSSRVGVLPVSFGWNDVGSWRALAALYPQDSAGNIVVGQHLGHDSTGLIVYSPEKLVATIGVSDLIIVQAGDVLLVCHKDRDQEVRALVDMLRARGQFEYL